jgi:hypothetical protein
MPNDDLIFYFHVLAGLFLTAGEMEAMIMMSDVTDPPNRLR